MKSMEEKIREHHEITVNVMGNGGHAVGFYRDWLGDPVKSMYLFDEGHYSIMLLNNSGEKDYILWGYTPYTK